MNIVFVVLVACLGLGCFCYNFSDRIKLYFKILAFYKHVNSKFNHIFQAYGCNNTDLDFEKLDSYIKESTDKSEELTNKLLLIHNHKKAQYVQTASFRLIIEIEKNLEATFKLIGVLPVCCLTRDSQICINQVKQELLKKANKDDLYLAGYYNGIESVSAFLEDRSPKFIEVMTVEEPEDNPDEEDVCFYN